MVQFLRSKKVQELVKGALGEEVKGRLMVGYSVEKLEGFFLVLL